MGSIYKLPDGKHIDLDKIISMELEYLDIFGSVKIHCQLSEKPIYFTIEDDGNWYGMSKSGRIKQKDRIKSKFDMVLNVWKAYKEIKEMRDVNEQD